MRSQIVKVRTHYWAFCGLLLFSSGALLSCQTDNTAFESRWDRANDRIWLGPEYWANPMEDWQIEAGRLECITPSAGRNVQVLTHQLGREVGGFKTSVRLGLVKSGKGSAGFEIGIHDGILDYRSNCIWGSGVKAYVTTDGQLRVADQTVGLADGTTLNDVTLELEAWQTSEEYQLQLTVLDNASGKSYGQLSTKVPADTLIGNIGLVHNTSPDLKNPTALFWFDEWAISGAKVEFEPSHAFGPILWAMHTVSNSRSSEGYVMKMTAQMPPLGENDANSVSLRINKNGEWSTIGEETIHPDARTATFRSPGWDVEQDMPYRLVYTMRSKSGETEDFYWTGTVRAEPRTEEFVLGGLTCQHHNGFPYAPVAENLATLNPDMLFFSGDQLYEANGGFGIIRTPADRAILNYLRKWYMFGWAFGDLMRDRPTITIPDDHDVFQGNIWGEGGAAPSGDNASSSGGYIQAPQFVNAVHRTHTAHHPDLFDPTPVLRGITVFYGDMVYGRVSFAIVGDRQFKSRPGLVDTGGGRLDHLSDPKIDVKTLDKPGLVLLGDRQIEFLEHWVEDWRGVDMKVLLSQTLFANVATHHGNSSNYLIADLDSGGWPQSARNRALEIVRKGFPLHVNGDQHVTTLVKHGISEQRDAIWSFCTPAISVGYQRWWRADEVGRKHQNRPGHQMENTGEYLDGFGNKVYVYSVGNPEGSRHKNRYQQAHMKASGFGLVRINHQQRTYTCESYKFLADLSANQEQKQFPGWPFTINQTDNYSRKPVGHLSEYSVEGMVNPVLKLYSEETGKLVYALRVKGNSISPWVFEDTKYTVRLGDPDTDKWEVFESQTIEPGH